MKYHYRYFPRTSQQQPPKPSEPPQIDFQQVELVYLEALQKQSKIDQLRLKELELAVNQSATKIQRFWRKRRLRRRIQSAITLQRWWRRRMKYFAYFKYVVQKFKRTFFLGTIQFAIKKYIRRLKHRPPLPQPYPPRCFTASKTILPTLKQKLLLDCNLSAQSQYMTNLFNYNKMNFTRQWERYQVELATFIGKQIQRQWIKKNGQWIDESGKVRDKDKVMRREMGKVFDIKYEKFQANQKEIQKAILNIKTVEVVYKERYYTKIENLFKQHRVTRSGKLL